MKVPIYREQLCIGFPDLRSVVENERSCEESTCEACLKVTCGKHNRWPMTPSSESRDEGWTMLSSSSHTTLGQRKLVALTTGKRFVIRGMSVLQSLDPDTGWIRSRNLGFIRREKRKRVVLAYLL